MLGGGVPGLAHAVEHAVSQVKVAALPGTESGTSVAQHPQQGKAEHPLTNGDTRTWHISFSDTTNLISFAAFRYMITENIDTDIENFKKKVICLISSLVPLRETAKYSSQ